MKLNNDTRIKYPPDSAGRLMITEVPVAHWRDTIGEIKALLYREINKLETINYIYLVNREQALKGVISIKDILRQPKENAAADAMVKDLVVVHPHTDQEHVAYRSLKHNIKALPVVDKDNKFLGIVPSDVILEVMHREASEDLLRMTGISHKKAATDNIMELSVLTMIKHRVPWLLIGLFGGMLVARIIGLFRTTLEENIILAAFIPLIVYTSGAIEAQMVTFMIRDMAVNYRKFKFSKYFKRQFVLVVSIAIILSTILYLFGFAFYQNTRIAFVVSIALLATIISSVFTGLIIPYIFSLFKQDPANASGPIATIIQDALSVTIYFLVASWLLQ